MAHSIQIVGEKILFFRDIDLMLLMRLIEARMRLEYDSYLELHEIANRWRYSWENYGPGTIDLELSEIASCPSKKYLFLRLIRDVKQWLRCHDPVLSRKKINDEFKIEGIVFFDYKIDFLNSVLDKIEDILD